jgi:hypothetical protein
MRKRVHLARVKTALRVLADQEVRAEPSETPSR